MCCVIRAIAHLKSRFQTSTRQGWPAGFSAWRSGFSPRLGHVRCVVGKMAKKQYISPQCFPVSPAYTYSTKSRISLVYDPGLLTMGDAGRRRKSSSITTFCIMNLGSNRRLRVEMPVCSDMQYAGIREAFHLLSCSGFQEAPQRNDPGGLAPLLRCSGLRDDSAGKLLLLHCLGMLVS